jgi:L-Ala-D/L-Glu epimerase
VFSIGMEDEPARMAEKARAAARYTRLKIKLDGNRPLEKITAIRAARPDAQLVIDANQGWTFAQLQDLTAPLARLGVAMIEQPLPRGEDDVLAGYDSAIALCADESCLHGGELDDAIARYQMVNIKLDKCGGLTAALALAGQVRAAGLRMMVGCMGGTSLAMAPAHVLAQLCDLVDIDGPLLLRNDRHGGLIYDGGRVTLPAKPIWGTAR